MAITSAASNMIQGGAVNRGIPWCYNATSADASGAETIIAAPGADTALYITQLTVITDANITVTLGAGEDSSAVETIVWGPIPFGSAGGVAHFDHRQNAIKLTDNKTLTVDASGAGNTCVVVEGFTV